MNERKKHFAVDKLGSAGRTLVDGMLGDNATYDAIVNALRAKTGEAVAISSLSRYHERKWFPLRQALEQTNHLHELVKESLKASEGKNLDEARSEMVKAVLFKVLAALRDPDPYKFYDLALSEGRLNLEKEKIAISKDKLKVEQQKVSALQKSVELKEAQIQAARDKAAAAEKKVEEMGRRKKLDPGVMKVIKEEIYGIVEPAY